MHYNSIYLLISEAVYRTMFSMYVVCIVEKNCLSQLKTKQLNFMLSPCASTFSVETWRVIMSTVSVSCVSKNTIHLYECANKTYSHQATATYLKFVCGLNFDIIYSK